MSLYNKFLNVPHKEKKKYSALYFANEDSTLFLCPQKNLYNGYP